MRRKSSSASTNSESSIEPSPKLNSLSPAPSRKTNVPKLKKFDDLYAFEQYLKDETWDNDFDFIHAKLTYYPPFIMNECHGDVEKIKPTMNCLNKKFVRNLHHHLDRHLIHDINAVTGVDYNFGKGEEEVKDGKLLIHFRDESTHGFAEEDAAKRRWNSKIDVESNSSDASVTIDFESIPIQ